MVGLPTGPVVIGGVRYSGVPEPLAHAVALSRQYSPFRTVKSASDWVEVPSRTRSLLALYTAPAPAPLAMSLIRYPFVGVLWTLRAPVSGPEML